MPAFSSIAIGAAVAGAAVSAGSAVAQGVAAGAEADAMGKQAQAQEAAAREAQAKAEKAAEPTAQELVQLQKQTDLADRTIARQEELIKAMDPALIEASQQALKLLKGEASGATQPLERARQRQRMQLENRLREQLGPGFETSSAGIEALSRFDTETADAVQGAQQQALGGITNFLSNSRNFRPDAGQLVGLSSIPMASIQNIASRRTAAAAGGMNLAQFAGSEHAAAAANAKAAGNIAGGIGSIGGSLIGVGTSMAGKTGGFGSAPEGGGLPAASSSGAGGKGFSLGVDTTLPKPNFA